MGLSWLLSLMVGPLLSGIWGIVFWSAGGLITGLSFGIQDWFIFRAAGGELRRLAGSWVLATTLGWAVGLALVIGAGLGDRAGFAFTGLIIGAAAGLPQWLVLKGRLARAWLWAAGQVLAWLAGFSSVELLGRAAGFPAAGAVSSAIGGLFFVLLLERGLSAKRGLAGTTDQA